MRTTTGLLLIILLLSACSTTKPDNGYPELVSVTQIPAYPDDIEEVTLRIAFHVDTDGSVIESHLLNSSGDESWDAALADSIQKWQFNNFSSEESFWFTQSIKGIFLKPTLLNMKELAFQDKADADSIHHILRRADFYEVLLQLYDDPDLNVRITKHTNKDIASYTKRVRDQLHSLRLNQHTKPLKVGNEFVIFRRIPEDESERLQS